MRRKNIIKATIFAIILCCFNLTIAEDVQTITKQQNEQLQSIEKQIDEEKQLVEDRYDQQIEALLKYTEDQAKKIYSSYRLLWIKYYDMIKDAPAKDNYLLSSSLFAHESDHLSNISGHLSAISGQTITKLNSTPRPQQRPNFVAYKTDRIRNQMIRSYSLYNAWTFLLDENAREFVAHIANNSNYGTSICVLRSQAREVLKLMNNLQAQLKRHQQYRQRALANLEEKELALKRDVLTKVTPVQEQSNGILNATAYVNGKWLAMIDDKVLYEGDTINNIKILEINNKQVKFSKNGQRWTQKLGENKASLWQ